MWGAGGWAGGRVACAGGLRLVVGERCVRMRGCDWRGGEGVAVVEVGHGWGMVRV